MSFEIETKEMVDQRSGTLDLSRLFALSEASRKRQHPTKATGVMKSSPIPAVMTPPATRNTSLVLRNSSPVLRPNSRMRKTPPLLDFLFSGPKPGPAKFPSPQEIKVGLVEGEGSRASRQFDLRRRGHTKVRVPFFLDRYVPAIFLKQLAGRPDDVLLRKAGREWDIVLDDEWIDLADRSKVFRLGPVQVYS